MSKSLGSLPILGFYDIPCGSKRGEAGRKKKKTEERGGGNGRTKYKKRQEGRLEAGYRSMHGPESAEFLRGWCLNGRWTECHSTLQHPPIPVMWAKCLGLAPPRGHEAHLSSVFIRKLGLAQRRAELSAILHSLLGACRILGSLQEGSQSLEQRGQEGALSPLTLPSQDERIVWD